MIASQTEQTAKELDQLPLNTRFELGPELTPIQLAFLAKHGYLIFNKVASEDEVQSINLEVDRITRTLVSQQQKSINGVPLFRGYDPDGLPSIQRLPFTSTFSNYIRDFISDTRFDPIRKTIGEETRIGHNEKDGCVVNTFYNVAGSGYPKLGWHTDGLRDLFYLRMPKQMLNVGLHLTDCPAENGGLRLIPGTHNQGFLSMCFRKPYFVSNSPDKNEVAVETRKGDLTIHDGRLWHRVEKSPHTGNKSFRRSMYVPYLTDAYQPKNEESKTPFYHNIGRLTRKIKAAKYKASRRR